MGWVKPGELGDPCPFHFSAEQRNKKRDGKTKKYFFKEEAIIKLASRSKCFCFSHPNYSKIFHGPLNWKCISLALQDKSVVDLNIGLND